MADRGQVVALASPSAAPPMIKIFAGPRNNYVVIKTDAGFTVTDIVGTGGTIMLTGVTELKFSDLTVNLLVAEKAKSISSKHLTTLIELYVAFFNRVPDADGLSYWIGRVGAGMSIEDIADSFYEAAIQYSKETGYSSTMNDADFVKIIYKNVLGRAGDTAPPDIDVAYWASQLARKQSSKGNLVATMLNAAHTYEGDPIWGWVPKLLNNKIQVATIFSVQQGINYLTPAESVLKGMAIAAAVRYNDITAASGLINLSDLKFNLMEPNSTVNTSVVNEVAACFKVNSNTVKYHVGFIGFDGKPFPTLRFEVIPLSGFSRTGKFRSVQYFAGKNEVNAISDYDILQDGLRTLSTVSGPPTLQTTITNQDGYMPFNLKSGVEVLYKLKEHVTIVANGKTFLDADGTKVEAVSLLEIAPLQTYAKLFPVTCKLKMRSVSANDKPFLDDGTFQTAWFAPGYGVVKLILSSSQQGRDATWETVSIEEEAR